MKKNILYEENPFGEVKLGKRVTLPNLPILEQIAGAEQTTKITLSLTTRSVERLKAEAVKLHVPYQVMIRRLLDRFVADMQ